MNKTPIQWTWEMGPDGKLIPVSGSTWNPLLGCRRVSPGCGAPGAGSCYAERLIATRFSKNPKLPMYHDIARVTEKGEPQFTGERRLVADRLDEPLRTRKGRKVFVCDMGDLLFEGHPFEDIAAVFGVMAAARQHTFQVLTKRDKRLAEFFAWDGRNEAMLRVQKQIRSMVGWSWPLPNVWLGVSVEDQKRKSRIDTLRTIPAAIRFLSVEPQIEDLGEVDLTGIHLVIQGGESGPGARPFDLAWARSVRDQCKAAGVAYFLKQLGANPHQSVNDARIGGSICDMRDSHGGDESEWPADLRGCRAFPSVPVAA